MLVQATMRVYKDTIAGFLPTPSKSHYVFNLRDFSRVVCGVLLVPHSAMPDTDKDKIVRLWIHETYRVFYDRLIDDDDRKKFFDIVRAACSDQFKINIDKALGHLTMSGNVHDETVRSLLFGDYMNPEGAKIYDEVTDLKQLQSVMEQYVHHLCIY